MEIKGSIAVITGGASGLGRAVVDALAKRGATVVLLDTNEKLAQEIAEMYQGAAIFCDVTQKDSVIDAFKKMKERVGTPRICVNCAGIITAERVVGKECPMPLENFSKTIDVNLIGTFNVLRIAVAEMLALPCEEERKEEERGIIINTASIAAFEGQIGQAAYSASKGGIASMTLPLARELAAYNIRVMGIAPGIFETPMLQSLSEKARARLLGATVFPKRLGRPKEFAELVVHIIENAMLNGSVIRLDGAIRLT